MDHQRSTRRVPRHDEQSLVQREVPVDLSLRAEQRVPLLNWLLPWNSCTAASQHGWCQFWASAAVISEQYDDARHGGNVDPEFRALADGGIQPRF